MKKNHFAVLLLLMILLFVVGTVVVAQSSANFDLSWNVIGNGGGEANSARYAVSGTVGQGVVGQTAVNSANFSLNSGYWTAGSTMQIYLPTIIKN